MSVLKVKDNGEWKAIPSIKGETGDAAGFGTATASVDTGTGTPSCVVTLTGEDTAKNFDFAFHNLMYDDSELQQDFDTLQGQFDTAVAALTVDSEVADIRVGDDGVTYTSAGAAVRGQFHDVKSAIINHSFFTDALQAAMLKGIHTKTFDLKAVVPWYQGRYYFTQNVKPSYAYVTNAYTFDEVIIKGFDRAITFSVDTGYTYSVAGLDKDSKAVYRLLGRTDVQTVNLKQYKSFIVYVTKSSGDMAESELSHFHMTIPVDQSLADSIVAISNKADANEKLIDADTDDITSDCTLITGKLYKNTNEEVEFANGRVLTKSVNPYDKYIVTTQGYNVPFPLYIVLDSSNNVLDYKYGTLDIMNTVTVNIPSGGTTLKVNSHANGISLTAVKTPSAIARKKELPSAQWLDKNVVWMGTSIPCGLPSNNYPDMVGEMLSCNMNNVAVGESSMWCKRPDRIDPTYNPYGFVESWVKCAKCLTNTVEETTWVLDHYNQQDGNGNYIFTINRPSSAPTSQQRTNYLACSYENKITPLLSTDVDCWVFDHGHNDDFWYYDSTGTRKTLDQMIDLYGINNLYTFETACYFLFDMIVNANNKARIIMIGELDNRLSYVKDHQIIVADSWEVPLYHTWEYLGWNVNHKITTTGYWSNGVWIESGGAEQEITIHDRFIPDHMHPHSDSSGYANEWIAKNIAQWMKNIAI